MGQWVGYCTRLDVPICSCEVKTIPINKRLLSLGQQTCKFRCEGTYLLSEEGFVPIYSETEEEQFCWKGFLLFLGMLAGKHVVCKLKKLPTIHALRC